MTKTESKLYFNDLNVNSNQLNLINVNKLTCEKIRLTIQEFDINSGVIYGKLYYM